MGLGKNCWPLSAIRQLADAFLGRGRRPQEEPRVRSALAESGGFCLRPGFGYPGDDFRIEQARRIYAAGLHVRQPGAERNRLVDLLGPRRRRPQSQSADRYLPAALRLPAAARQQEAAAREPLACCAKCGAPPPAWNCCRSAPRPSSAMRSSNASRPAISRRASCGASSRLGARKLFYGPINLVVPPATVDALGGSAAAHPRRRRRAGRHGAPHRRPHARPARRHPRSRARQARRRCRTPTACSPCSKAKKRTTARWAASSAKNCPPAWCWLAPQRRINYWQ